MAKQHAKFVQVATSIVNDDDGGTIESIIAVDADGEVWRYIDEDERWEKLADERYVAEGRDN